MDELKNCKIKKISKRQGLVRSNNLTILNQLINYISTKGYVAYSNSKISDIAFNNAMDSAEEKQITKKSIVEYI